MLQRPSHVRCRYVAGMRSVRIEHMKESSGQLAMRRLAQLHASELASIIHEIRAAGFVTWRAMTYELNQRGIPTARGGRWHSTSVGRVLTRLGMTIPGTRGGNGAWANRSAAELRAKTLAATLHELQLAGFISHRAIAHELNVRQVPTARGGKWHRTGVAR